MRVRFELAGVFYHDDDLYYNIPSIGCSNTLATTFGVDVDRVINVFYYTSSTPGSLGCGQNGYVNMKNCFPDFNQSLIRHELGHVVGLGHTFICGGPVCQDDGFSDTYYPDCNQGWTICGPDAVWTQIGNGCTAIGTGVSNNVMGYNTCRRYYSPKQLAHVQSLYITSSTRRMYVTCDPSSHNPPITITQSAIWASAKIVNADIVIEPGKVLDVRCKVYMSPHAKIIVKPGAKLIVDGGWVTSHSGGCNTFWQGIQVWGTTTQHQYGSPNPTYQGLVVLKNGAVVEHALIGVQTQNPDALGTAGGIVQVQGTLSQLGGTFLNCKKAVDFDAYQNFNPNNSAQLRSNRSYFNFCDFIVDDNYRGGNDFQAHVDLWKVDGLRFKGCNFKNLQTTITESDQLGQGILSLDAQYTVSGACTTLQPCCEPCPSANLIPSTFVGLDHGIDASITETDRSLIVTDCAFHDNVVGVLNRGTNSFQVLRSNFNGGGRIVNLNDVPDQDLGRHVAIFSTGGHGFRIEENHFERSVGATTPFAGAWINNSKEYNDQVYKNSSVNCDPGYEGELQCFDPAHPTFIGLQMLCNTNSNPGGHDIEDIKHQGDQDDYNHSMRTVQGSKWIPAGNTFTQQTVPLDESDFRNNTNWQLGYWYHESYEQPLDITGGWVGPNYSTHVNSCPSNFTNGHLHPFAPSVITAVKAQFNTSKLAYINTAYAYNALLDGGNTDQLITEVEESWPQDAWTLHDLLMAKSPYLSEEVLRTTVTKNILPQAMLLEVLLANPEATKQRDFIRWLQYDAPYPLPQYMVDLIVGSWDQHTFRADLEDNMGQQHVDMTFAANLLIGECKSDTIGQNTDSLLVYWQRVPSLGARYSEALTRMQRGEYTQATALMTGLENGYRLNAAQQTERNNTLGLIAALAAAHNAGHDLMHLTAAERTAITLVAERGCDRPSLWAQNLLCYRYGQCYPLCTGEATSKKAVHGPDRAVVQTAALLSIYPNPATSYTTLAYHVDKLGNGPAIVVRNVDGRELKRFVLNTAIGQVLLDTRDYVPGTYSVELLNDGSRIDTKRLVLKP